MPFISFNYLDNLNEKILAQNLSIHQVFCILNLLTSEKYQTGQNTYDPLEPQWLLNML